MGEGPWGNGEQWRREEPSSRESRPWRLLAHCALMRRVSHCAAHFRRRSTRESVLRCPVSSARPLLHRREGRGASTGRTGGGGGASNSSEASSTRSVPQPSVGVLDALVLDLLRASGRGEGVEQ